MSPTRQEMQAEVLKAARRGQAAIIEVIRTSAGVVRSARPQEHLGNLPFASKLPRPEHMAGSAREFAGKLPKPDELAGTARQFAEKLPRPDKLVGNARELAGKLPRPDGFASKLPKVDELVANARHFTERVLASQQKFTEDARRAATALLPNASNGSETAASDAGTSETAGTGTDESATSESSTDETGAGSSNGPA
jgi:hypothetical protein